MKCAACQFDNREGAQFCKERGKKLELSCPSCGHPYQSGSKFCDECGYNLTLSKEPPKKELSFDEKLAKIQRYLPKDLTQKILAQRDKIEGGRSGRLRPNCRGWTVDIFEKGRVIQASLSG
jgi:uncharacterized Zn finger protein (UPF0148 family)